MSLLASANAAAAAADVSLDPAPDGTLVLVGSGWRPGQQLVVSVGHDVYPAMADSTGGFEVRTGLAANAAPAALTVRRQDTSALAQTRLSIAQRREGAHPYAVLFAQSLATGAALFAVSACGIGALVLTARSVLARR